MNEARYHCAKRPLRRRLYQRHEGPPHRLTCAHEAGSDDADGAVAGGQIGYRWQSAAFVFGLEAQGDWADLSGSRVSILNPLFSTGTKTDGIGLFTGQLGWAWNAALLYVKGGAAVTDDKYRGTVTTAPFQGAVFDHHLGHGIGLFPHEAPHLNSSWNDVFEEGDVFTCEPGIYIPEENIGIRIENNILLNETRQ